EERVPEHLEEPGIFLRVEVRVARDREVELDHLVHGPAQREIAADVVKAALDKGLLVNNVAPSVVRLCPPLIVEAQQCETAVDILDAVFSQIGKGNRP
ncbi:MAG: aminotransferase class III-fold pyridoxal phosphate-dependent enzyme, partial [Actinobacteria bacterium]|nr:aminotransferase class III-fold pyridoxal phosphate-dependent enzyme [Actinomycetota bacterium]